MILFIVFTILGIIVGLSYFFGQNKFSLARLFFSLWLLSVGLAQLRLSPYENVWSGKFWLMLMLFFAIFGASYYFFQNFLEKKKVAIQTTTKINEKIFLIIILVLTFFSLAANAYIFSRFGTLPILSSMPDKLRFIINKQIFGLWEYAALLPRLIIPLSFIYLLITRPSKKAKIAIIASIVLCFLVLSLYASRLVIILPILICYFSYLILNVKKINWRKIIAASCLVLVLVLTLSVAIPTFRHFITYRDYYTEVDYNPFTYLADLSQLNIPKELDFLIPLYLIPAFNLQALSRATDFFQWPNLYFGSYGLSVFDSLLTIFHLPQFEVVIPWKQMFLPWWVTATLLFNYWVDFGWLGIAAAGIFWGILLSTIYCWATKKPTLLSAMLFAYFSFVVIMSIYTNYLMREEFYLDLVLIFIVALLANKELAKAD